MREGGREGERERKGEMDEGRKDGWKEEGRGQQWSLYILNTSNN